MGIREPAAGSSSVTEVRQPARYARTRQSRSSVIPDMICLSVAEPGHEGGVQTLREGKPIAQDNYSGGRFQSPKAQAASGSCGLLLGLQLLHGLRYCGAVHARQAPRDPPGRERVFMVDGSEFAAADPDLMRA